MKTAPEIPAQRVLAARLVLLGHPGSREIAEALQSGGHTVTVTPLATTTIGQLRECLPATDIVLVDLSASSSGVLTRLNEINAAIGICNYRPRLLCVSTVHRNPHFVLAVEKCGARYVRISSPVLLLEAADLLLTEMNELQRIGPSFKIVHRYSLGHCAPGEEISAVLWAQGSNEFQLPMGLAQRFIFDYLAQCRLAVDSEQIISGLTGGWFYREHASNSGHRQLKKIRRATVKVLIQRIRKAMASAFAQAHLRLDSREVLRSCPAEGNKRVLYKLHADVQWHHVLR